MADAVVDPWTEVVHFENASLHLLTVVGSDWFPCVGAVALFAEINWHVLFVVRWIQAQRNKTWVNPCRPLVRDKGSQTKAIEGHAIPQAPTSKWNSLNELVVDVAFMVPVEDAEAISTVHSICK